MSDTFNTEREAILRRVQKLLAIAQDDRADPNEAAAAASQAEKIMRKFNIDYAQDILGRIKTGHDMATEQVIATAKDNGTASERVPPWAQWLSVAVANMHDCGARGAYTFTDKGREVCIEFFGYKDDVRVAAWTFDYLVKTVNRLCKAFRKDVAYIVGGRPVMNSYRHGVVQGILATIRKQAAERAAEQQQAVSSRALVVAKKQAVEEHFGEIKYRQTKSKTKVDAHSFSRGMEVGRKVDVNRRGIEGSSQGNTAPVPTARRLS